MHSINRSARFGKPSALALRVCHAGALLFALVTGFPIANAANILINSGFEAGDLRGWTVSGNTGFIGAACGGVPHTEGNCAAFLGPFGADGSLSQSFSTIARLDYFLQFSVLFDGGSPSDFSAFINGNQIFSRTNPALSPNFLTVTSFFQPATAISSISFVARNDTGFFWLDNVVVSVVPEPSSIALLTLGLSGLAILRRGRRMKRDALHR